MTFLGWKILFVIRMSAKLLLKLQWKRPWRSWSLWCLLLVWYRFESFVEQRQGFPDLIYFCMLSERSWTLGSIWSFCDRYQAQLLVQQVNFIVKLTVKCNRRLRSRVSRVGRATDPSGSKQKSNLQIFFIIYITKLFFINLIFNSIIFSTFLAIYQFYYFFTRSFLFSQHQLLCSYPERASDGAKSARWQFKAGS